VSAHVQEGAERQLRGLERLPHAGPPPSQHAHRRIVVAVAERHEHLCAGAELAHRGRQELGAQERQIARRRH
jgi:hypothetical protein